MYDLYDVENLLAGRDIPGMGCQEHGHKSQEERRHAYRGGKGDKGRTNEAGIIGEEIKRTSLSFHKEANLNHRSSRYQKIARLTLC